MPLAPQTAAFFAVLDADNAIYRAVEITAMRKFMENVIFPQMNAWFICAGFKPTDIFNDGIYALMQPYVDNVIMPQISAFLARRRVTY